MIKPHPRSWFTTAIELRDEVAKLPYGKRESGLKIIAGNRGWSAQTLRRTMTALAFVEKIEAETKIRAKHLARFPVAAIEYAHRIYRRNPANAVLMLQELIAGSISVAELKKYEEDSREEAATRSGKSLELAFRQETAQAIERLVGEELKEVDVKAFYDPRVFIDFVSAIHDWRTAVVIVGPYQDPALYGKRAFSWIAKAYTLLARFERVFLILPSNADASQFKGWTESLRIWDDRLRLAQLNANASTLKLDGPETFGVESKHAR